MGECQVCCCAYTGVKRKLVECAFCAYQACSSCVQKYLVSAPQDAQCMACKTPWNREFVDANFTRSWVLGAYKAHRERVLVEREMALLPASQAMVENYRAAREVETELQDIRDEHTQLHRRMMVLTLDSQAKHAQLRNLQANSYRGARVLQTTGGADRRTFVRACPSEGCRGFLSTAWKCGVCDVYVCPKCHEIKGQERAGEHVCNPDNVATAALLAKDTRPCPKCGSLIHKIEGCDQMFCTACNTAFSWTSGVIVTTGIHNPHWYDYMRRTQGYVPRAQGDIPCGGLCGLWELTNNLRQRGGGGGDDAKMLERFHRSVVHVQNNDMRRLAGHYGIADNADLRLKYLIKEIDAEEWKRRLQQREKKRSKDLEMRMVFQMYCNVVSEGFRKLLAAEADVLDTLRELRTLRDYANVSLQAIAQRYNMSPHQIYVN